MNNIAFDKDKDLGFQDNSVQNGNHIVVETLPSVVTVCLAPCNICTGEYIDITSSYRMRCCCRCHDNKFGKTVVNEGGIS
jgi:hypothetical protein